MCREDDMKDAFFDGKLYARKGKTHLNSFEYYQYEGTPEYGAFWQGYRLEKAMMEKEK